MLRTVIHKVQEIAAEVIRQTGKDKPADAALREVLKQIKDLAPFDATEIAKTVFIYYRWHVWLRDERGVESKMRLALRLDDRFRADESNVPLAELRAKAVPAWTAEQMEVSDDWLLSLQRATETVAARQARNGGRAGGKIVWRRKSAELLPDALLFRGEEDLFKTPEFHAGEFEIQDIASQVVGLLCDPQARRNVVGHLRRRRRQDAAPFRLDAKQGPDLGERPRGMAIAKTQAAHRPGKGFQLSFGILGRRREVADENQIRRRARGRAVQRHRNVATQSAGALDDGTERCARAFGNSEKTCWQTSRRA